MNGPNYAEFEARINAGTVTLEEARRMGSTHRAYGWARTPPGSFDAERQQAYYDGYDAAKLEVAR